jgi:hypothetical protein
MKKLLSIFGAIGLVVTPMSSFSISCSSPKSLPHYNSDGDFNEQVNDAWDTSILKTVSTWTKPQPDSDPDSSQLSDEPATINMTLIKNQLQDLIVYRFENHADITSDVISAAIEKIGFFENKYANSNSINNDEELAARLKVSDKIYFSLDGKTFLDLVVTDKPLAKCAYKVYSTKSDNYEAILRFDGNKFKALKETWNSDENGARADITKQFLTSLGNNSIIITKNNGSEEKQLARDYFVHSFQTKSPKISSFENELFNWNKVAWDTWLGEFINGKNDGDGIYGISFDPTIQ